MPVAGRCGASGVRYVRQQPHGTIPRTPTRPHAIPRSWPIIATSRDLTPSAALPQRKATPARDNAPDVSRETVAVSAMTQRSLPSAASQELCAGATADRAVPRETGRADHPKCSQSADERRPRNIPLATSAGALVMRTPRLPPRHARDHPPVAGHPWTPDQAVSMRTRHECNRAPAIRRPVPRETSGLSHQEPARMAPTSPAHTHRECTASTAP